MLTKTFIGFQLLYNICCLCHWDTYSVYFKSLFDYNSFVTSHIFRSWLKKQSMNNSLSQHKWSKTERSMRRVNLFCWQHISFILHRHSLSAYHIEQPPHAIVSISINNYFVHQLLLLSNEDKRKNTVWPECKFLFFRATIDDRNVSVHKKKNWRWH
jgi:hypothetical protein